MRAEVAYTDPPSSRVSIAAGDMNSLVHRLPHISPEGGNVRWLQSVDGAKDTYLLMRPFLTKGIASVSASPFRGWGGVTLGYMLSPSMDNTWMGGSTICLLCASLIKSSSLSTAQSAGPRAVLARDGISATLASVGT